MAATTTATKRITHLTINALADGRELVIEADRRGAGALVVRVRGQSRAYLLRYYHNGTRRLESLGVHDDDGAAHWRDANGWHKGGRLTLRAAREGYREMSDLQRRVGDLKAHFAREAAEAAAAAAAAKQQRDDAERIGSLAHLLDAYADSLAAENKASAREVRRLFARHVVEAFPTLAAKPARDVTPDDVLHVLKRLVAAGCTRQVNVLRSYLRAAFRHGGRGHDYDPVRAAKEDVVFRLAGNPVDMVRRVEAFDRIGTRVLTAGEVRLYARLLAHVPAAGDAESPDPIARAAAALNLAPLTRLALRVHLLTGAQRPKQLFAAEHGAYNIGDDTTATVTLIDAKGRGSARTHLVPLLPEAVALVKSATVDAENIAWPFACLAKSPIRIETLSKAVKSIACAQVDGKPLFASRFTLRDVRRTVETQLAALGVSRETRAQLLSHGRGDKIARVYDHHHYLTEKRGALEVWRAFLAGDTAAGATVIALHTTTAQGAR
ncbi:MAG: hypothetical protein IT495_10045 [Gammaproteobacteria bacterium]|nr:hypothetical protein [Gammaproteobacteria bacterium]